ncbi:reverse transcriptase domain-containing protein [Tanacetum coccineum]
MLLTEIHGINRRQNKGLQAFMDRFKSEGSHIKGVPSVLRISAFMHGHGHPELAKKLNDKIPKTVDEMFERVRAFIRGEVVVGSAEMVRPSQGDKGYIHSAWSKVSQKDRNRGGPREARRNMGVYTPYPRKDTFTLLIKTPKEILAIESVSFLKLPPLIRTPKKQNLNKLCDYHGDRGHNINECYQIKKQIKEAVTSGKLAHLVKDIRRNNQRNGNQGRNGVKVITMIREEGNLTRPSEEGRGQKDNYQNSSDRTKSLSVASFMTGSTATPPTLVNRYQRTKGHNDLYKPNKKDMVLKKTAMFHHPYRSLYLHRQLKQMSQNSKEKLQKENFSANHEEEIEAVKDPANKAEQWLDNEISFPSTPGCQLVDSPIILKALIEGFLVRRIYVDRGTSSKVMYEHYFRNLRAETRAKLKESRTPLVGFSGEVSYPIGTINLNVTIGDPERLRTIPMEFAVVKSHSPYNVILGRTGLRSLGAIASTIHSMIKFPTANEIAIVITKKETLYECRRMEEAQGPVLEGRIAFPQIPALGSEGTTNTSREEIQGQTKEGGEPKDTVQPPPSPPEKDTLIDEKN